MANHSKNKKFDQQFVIKGDGVLHRPKKVHEHIAREMFETYDRDTAESMIRHLTPDAKDRVMGKLPGTYKQPGWHPAGGRSFTRFEMTARGGMVS